MLAETEVALGSAILEVLRLCAIVTNKSGDWDTVDRND
jgi:hypothetical protein